MQILAVNFDPQAPTCPACKRRLHRHGHYARRKKGIPGIIPRWLCSGCHRTFSILPADLLPYRDLSCAEVQQGFDAWAFNQQPPASKPIAAALKSFLQPAIQAELQHSCGQLLEVPLASGQALWRGIRQFCSSVDKLLRWLGEHSGLSLLGRYACQRPVRRIPRTTMRDSSASFQTSVPHNFFFQDQPLQLLRSREFG